MRNRFPFVGMSSVMNKGHDRARCETQPGGCDNLNSCGLARFRSLGIHKIGDTNPYTSLMFSSSIAIKKLEAEVADMFLVLNRIHLGRQTRWELSPTLRTGGN